VVALGSDHANKGSESHGDKRAGKSSDGGGDSNDSGLGDAPQAGGQLSLVILLQKPKNAKRSQATMTRTRFPSEVAVVVALAVRVLEATRRRLVPPLHQAKHQLKHRRLQQKGWLKQLMKPAWPKLQSVSLENARQEPAIAANSSSAAAVNSPRSSFGAKVGISLS
jgi:hypothetical protein